MDPQSYQQALATVRSGLAEVEETGDAAILFDQETIRAAADLLDYARTHPDDAIAALTAAGRLYWKRHLTNLQHRDGADLTAAICLFTKVYRADRFTVPEALWGRIAEIEDVFVELSPAVLSPAELVAEATAIMAVGADQGEVAVLLLRTMLVTLPTDHPDRPELLSELAIALDLRRQAMGDADDFRLAVEAAEQGLALMAPTHPGRAVLLSRLGLILWERYAALDNPDDLDRSITLNRAAVTAAGRSDPPLAGCLHNLSIALWSRWQTTGDTTYLDEAIDAGRRSATPAAGPAMSPLHAAQLMVLLTARGTAADLDEAAAAGHVALTSADNPYQVEIWAAFGAIEEHRGNRDSAIAWYRKVLDDGPDDYRRRNAIQQSLEQLTAALEHPSGRS
ncbi:hypothetical protein AB0M22_31910 [Nocardia sp. NPDC051756]|uniref:hypothetical protein n=1 Tax=Nocardia sp. NPDC051756 TaxID=3154751 RepID=UPI003414FCC0